MDLRKLAEPLRPEQIEFRVQSINNGGYATILAYKDARCDMQRLDDVCGPLNWKREHLNNNANCIVSIFNKDSGQWVGKEDTGTASNTEAAKGLASDSFKRACFNWGIGRELYDYPQMSIQLKADEFKSDGNKVKQTWNLKLKEWTWKTLFEGNKVVAVAAHDQTGAKRFSWRSDGHNEFIGTLTEIKQLHRAKDAEGLVVALDKLSNDEGMYESIWSALTAPERREIKDMSTAERKAQKEESVQ